MSRKKRTDVHRPGVLVPAHYSPMQYYALPRTEAGFGMPPINLDCTWPVPVYDRLGNVAGHRVPTCPDTGRCCVASIELAGRRIGVAIHGAAGKCGVCGAHFVYGTIFLHDPTGELVHMGHDCAAKYELMHDASALELELRRSSAASAAQISRTKNAAALVAFCAAHPGLEGDLELGRADGSREERIIADIGDKLSKYRSLSDKQVELVARLAERIRRPPPARPEDNRVDAPVGAGVEFVGEIVSVRVQEGYRGNPVIKMTVRVDVGGGSWLAFGTMPKALYVDVNDQRPMSQRYRGRWVRVRASLERPPQRCPDQFTDDEQRAALLARNAERHFVWMSRPRATYVDDPRIGSGAVVGVETPGPSPSSSSQGGDGEDAVG